MKKAQALNKSKNRILLEEATVATTFWARLKGLLGKTELKENEGLIIYPCNSVHTVGMKFSIDVIFVNEEDRVCKIIPDMKKTSFSPIVKGSRYVIEVESGFAKKYKVEVDDEILLEYL